MTAAPRRHGSGSDEQMFGAKQQIPPAEQSDYEAYVTAARSALGKEAFRVAWEAGQTRPWEETVGSVLSTGTT